MSDGSGEHLFGPGYSSISRYVDLLSSVGLERGLIGPREVDRIWERHILNSASVSGLIPRGAEIADVGSGAGLPGIPLALLRPDLQVTLIEPLLRRAQFLSEIVTELDLGPRVSVMRARAEEVTATYEVVVARAVAPLVRLLTWCAPLLTERGVLLALKGARAEVEVAEAAALLRQFRLSAVVLEVRAHADADPTRVVRVSRGGARTAHQ